MKYESFSQKSIDAIIFKNSLKHQYTNFTIIKKKEVNMKLKIKTMLENALSGILVILGTVMVLALSLQLLDIVRMFIPIKDHLDFIVVVQKVLSFFVFFELVMMIIEYIKDNSITVRYLIYICITAILRQIMTIHNDAIDIIILSGAIFILVAGLAILEVVYKKREENVMIEKKHEKEK